MGKALITEQYLTNIGNAIRARNGSSIAYKVSDMAQAVANLPNQYSAGDEGKVVSSGALVGQSTRNVTENGTYDTTLNNEVVVSVSGGGGNVPVIPQNDWDAMTTSQKQAQGLVIIQTATTGYERGMYVNGADYVESLLPYSDASHIICEASLDNFDSTQLSWGRGTNPITLSANVDVYAQDSNAVYIPTAADGTLAYVDLGDAGKAFTAYIVMKLINPSTYTRVLGAMASRGPSQGMLLYGATISVSSWANDTNTGVSSSADYFVGCIRFDPTAASKGYGKVNLTSGITKAPSTVGRYLTIGRTDIDPSTTNAEPANSLVKFLGVVSEAESDSVIAQNIASLMDTFGIS